VTPFPPLRRGGFSPFRHCTTDQSPDLYVGYFRDLGNLAAMGEMTPEAILAVMARYATYPAGTPAPDSTH